jgi:hypothetical protein
MRRHLPLLAALTMATVVSTGFGVEAGPLSDAAEKAEKQATAGDAAGARETLSQAVFVTATPTGYAMYEPKQGSVFKAGEKLISYVEPVGLTWKEASAEGKLETRFTVDLDLVTPTGEILASHKAFGDFTFTGYRRNQEIYATLTVDVSGAPAGDYVLRFRFNDINSGKSASVDQPFKIAAQ